MKEGLILYSWKISSTIIHIYTECLYSFSFGPMILKEIVLNHYSSEVEILRRRNPKSMCWAASNHMYFTFAI
jgi:hypothetical protein